jgi:DNA polymerase III delta prime subunit
MSIAANPSHFLWEEKYRPASLDDVVIPDALKAALKGYVAEGAIPSMLFYSPSPGTGKTTTAFAIANGLDIKPLFINASLDNSIDDIRMKVVQYATSANMFNSSKKLVILDEGERLSSQAQESLKGLIEQVSGNCSFLITTNAKSRIIEPLKSRCTEIDFVYSAADQTKLAAMMLKRVFVILKEENVTFDQASLIQVVKKFAPDNRRILKTLQAYAKVNGNVIDAGILGKLSGYDSAALIEAMKGKKYDEVKSWCMNNYERLGDDFYLKMFKTLEPIVQPQSVPQIVLTMNDYQRYHATVPDRFIHFLSLMTQLMMETGFKS